MPEVIYTYQNFLNASSGNPAALFWIVEYSPNELGFIESNIEYLNSSNRYSLFRNECLNNPIDFKDRLDNRKYRIWTTTPKNIEW